MKDTFAKEIRDIFYTGWEQARKKYTFQSVPSKEKPGVSFVSEVDVFLEEYYKAELKRLLPKSAIWAEESGREESKNGQQIIHLDPLDGTHNFISNSSPFGSMIAIQEGDHIDFSAVYDPLRDCFYWSKSRTGAYLEDTRFVYNPKLLASKASLMMEGKTNNQFFFLTEQLLKKNHLFRSIRKYGCMLPPVTYASSGWLHTYCIVNANAYDIFPVIGILQEANFIILKLNGEPWDIREEKSFIATVPEFVTELQELLQYV